MNRTEDYLQKVDKDTQRPFHPYRESFYDTINGRIEDIDRKLVKSISYKDVLALEEHLSTLYAETQQTLDYISVEGSSDLVLHFEGIKRIIHMKFQNVEKRLKNLKDSKIGINIDLEPERPQQYREVNEISVMEEENKRLVERYNVEGYRLTRKRLLEVEAIQDTIFQHLSLQDERIDDVIDLTSRARKCVGDSNSTLEKIGESGKFFRRFLIVLLLCLSFVLLFLHYYYR